MFASVVATHCLAAGRCPEISERIYHDRVSRCATDHHLLHYSVLVEAGAFEVSDVFAERIGLNKHSDLKWEGELSTV